ncbi:hypothetical protein T190607A01A_30193 [Tenacibaculum sp. 190524A05c]|uniref:Uncharacterized protein n=1 Tax=Tenacibaculum platacis TaxID=3137852 RepID=A0ABM9P372_9FLAO
MFIFLYIYITRNPNKMNHLFTFERPLSFQAKHSIFYFFQLFKLSS